MDYDEERRSELEVLESIFPDELSIISADQLSIRVEPESQPSAMSYALLLKVTYTPTYPEEAPQVELETVEGDLADDELERLKNGLDSTAQDSLGMAMVYTLTQYLRDSIGQVLDERKEREQREADERARQEEEELARKNAGTKVTPESFAAWRAKFEKEMEALRRKQEEDRLRALPPKEREEVKKMMSKLTGRQLFERDLTGKLAKQTDDEEDGADVDFRQYDRTSALAEEDEDQEAAPLPELDDDSD